MVNHRGWKSACVLRAQTIAPGLRLIDFAVEDSGFALGPSGQVAVQVSAGGAVSVCCFPCIEVGPGHICMAVKLDEPGRDGSRFMWSLIEGARIRLAGAGIRFDLLSRGASSVLAHPRALAPVRLRCAGLRLDFRSASLLGREGAECISGAGETGEEIVA